MLIKEDTFKKIEEITKRGDVTYKTLISGFIESLPGIELSEYLKRYVDNCHIRKKLLDKMKEYCLDKNYLQNIHDLVSFFLRKINNENDVRKKYGILRCLHSLFPYVNNSKQIKIVETLLKSLDGNIRYKGYNLKLRKINKAIEQLVLENLQEFDAVSCLRYIIVNFNDELIEHYFDMLCDFSRENDNSFLNKLFLRLPKLSETRLKQLRSIDEVTYVYVCAKKNINVTNKDAINMYNKEVNKIENANRALLSHRTPNTFYLDNDRTKVLLWCYAKMGLWQVIKDILHSQKINTRTWGCMKEQPKRGISNSQK